MASMSVVPGPKRSLHRASSLNEAAMRPELQRTETMMVPSHVQAVADTAERRRLVELAQQQHRKAPKRRKKGKKKKGKKQKKKGQKGRNKLNNIPLRKVPDKMKKKGGKVSMKHDKAWAGPMDY